MRKLGSFATNPEFLSAKEYEDALSQLHLRIFRPLQPMLEERECILIAPDGDLLLVSFAALVYSGDRTFYEHHVFEHIFAAGDLLGSDGAFPPGSGLLTLGGPDFSSGTASPAAFADGTYRESRRAAATAENETAPSLDKCPCRKIKTLEGSRRESEAVAALWPGESQESSIVLVGSQATEESFRRNAPGKRILHLATDGFVMGNVDAASGTAIPAVGEPELLAQTREPIPASGLCLAGSAANRTEPMSEGNDGILTAEEVANLNLEGCELVVLSACMTGSGQAVSGEGMYGLARAFRLAGARNVICAPWPVDDAATAEYMKHLLQVFFRRGTHNVGLTMREAAETFSTDAQVRDLSYRPVHWGAFIAYGDGHPR
ncbi:CHAT domain-containing protein [bacterium]|nr:CHAT domain-containing protein [bacterium]MBU1984758.1 CHAT domain-containing protein [bacterium]